MKTRHCSRVVGYELDSNGHVNNAVYLNYLEAARWEGFFEIDAIRLLNSHGISPVITEMQIKYKRELFMFNKFEVLTEWESTGTFIFNNQKIINERGKTVAKARSKLVLVSKDRIICDIPMELHIRLNSEEELWNKSE